MKNQQILNLRRDIVIVEGNLNRMRAKLARLESINGIQPLDIEISLSEQALQRMPFNVPFTGKALAGLSREFRRLFTLPESLQNETFNRYNIEVNKGAGGRGRIFTRREF